MAFDIALRDPGVKFNVALSSGSVAPSITVAQTMPPPSQGATVQTIINCIIVETLLAPSQSITAEAKVIYPVTVAETLLAPSQAIVADFTPGVNPKPLGAGGPRGAWSYYPPVYAIRTKGRQEAPAPRQKARIRQRQNISGMQSALVPRQGAKAQYIKKIAFCRANLAGLTPSQSCDLWPHRLPHVREAEERKILLMLLGFDMDDYEIERLTESLNAQPPGA